MQVVEWKNFKKEMQISDPSGLMMTSPALKILFVHVWDLWSVSQTQMED